MNERRTQALRLAWTGIQFALIGLGFLLRVHQLLVFGTNHWRDDHSFDYREGMR